jgi:LacI family transcriptional regulator
MMKAKYYSTSELAEKTGTSRQVVSAIINENWKQKRISQATYDRITKEMDELGFVPDRTAISLRKVNRNTVGLLCHGPLYSHTLVALEKLNHYFLQSKKSVEMHVSSAGGLTEAIREMMGHRVESIIIFLSPMLENFGEEDLNDKSLHRLLRVVPNFIYNFPFEVHDRAIEDKLVDGGSHLIGFSRLEAYHLFFTHLLKSGHTRILVDEKILKLFRSDSEAFQLISKMSRIEKYPNPQSGKLDENPFLLGEKLANRLLPKIKENKFDYIITFSDRIAQGVATVLSREGIIVPNDIRVMGFDKIDSLSYMKYPISTIEVPLLSMLKDLIAVLEAKKESNQINRSKPKLLINSDT